MYRRTYLQHYNTIASINSISRREMRTSRRSSGKWQVRQKNPSISNCNMPRWKKHRWNWSAIRDSRQRDNGSPLPSSSGFTVHLPYAYELKVNCTWYQQDTTNLRDGHHPDEFKWNRILYNESLDTTNHLPGYKRVRCIQGSLCTIVVMFSAHWKYWFAVDFDFDVSPSRSC